MTRDHSALIERLEGGCIFHPRHYWIVEPDKTDALLAEAAAALRDLTEWRTFAQSVADVPIERESLNYTITNLRFGRGALAKETKAEAVLAAGTLRDILSTARSLLPLPSAPNQAKEAGE